MSASVLNAKSEPHSYVEQCARKRMGNLGGLLVVIFSPIKIGQFQRPSPNRAHQFPLRFGGCAAAWWCSRLPPGNSHNATVSISAPRTVTEIARLSVEPGVREAR